MVAFWVLRCDDRWKLVASIFQRYASFRRCTAWAGHGASFLCVLWHACHHGVSSLRGLPELLGFRLERTAFSYVHMHSITFTRVNVIWNVYALHVPHDVSRYLPARDPTLSFGHAFLYVWIDARDLLVQSDCTEHSLPYIVGNSKSADREEPKVRQIENEWCTNSDRVNFRAVSFSIKESNLREHRIGVSS